MSICTTEEPQLRIMFDNDEIPDTATPPTGEYLPSGAYHWRVPVRAYEPSANGRMGPGNLLRYCEVAANAASAASGFTYGWYADRGEGWVTFRQTIELAAPISIGGSLDLLTWVQSFARVRSQRNYRLVRASDGATVGRCSTTWAFVDSASQTPKRIPTIITEHIPLLPRPALGERATWGDVPTPLPPPANVIWRARSYEADSLKHINNCVYADWLTEAAANAFAEWTNAADPRLAAHANTLLLPRRLTITYIRSVLPGDEISITTTPERVGSRGIAIAQTITLRADPTTPIVTVQAVYLTSRQ